MAFSVVGTDSLMPHQILRSQELFERAKLVIPGGVNSPVRAWNAVAGEPLFMVEGKGARVRDADGREFIDYVCSWGPLVLGHAAPQVIATLQEALVRGTTFGAPTEKEVELAEMVCTRVPSIEKLRLVNSGTEATMSVIRLARAFTHKNKILKFDGCYHGHTDSLLVKAGSGQASLSLPDSAGIPEAFATQTLVAPFNALPVLERMLEREKREIAAVIMEPVCGNMGVIPPQPGFLEAVRDMTSRYGVLLIFDEVITGFRVAPGGVQELYGVTPDLTCLGKILGGGLPIGAFGGRKEIMDLLAPVGTVYQAGTLSGNPLAVSAGIAVLRALDRPGVYDELDALGRELEEGFLAVSRHTKLPLTVNRVGSMATVFFGVDEVVDAAAARRIDRARFTRYFHNMLTQGIYLPPSPYEAMFVSLAHQSHDIARTVEAFRTWASEEVVA